MSWLFSGGSSAEDRRKAAIAAPVQKLRGEQNELKADIRALERTIADSERLVTIHTRRLEQAIGRGDKVRARRAAAEIGKANQRFKEAERQITRLRRLERNIGSVVNEANMAVVTHGVNGSVRELNQAVGGVVGARRDVMRAARDAVTTASVFEQFGEMESTINESLAEVREAAAERVDEENEEEIDEMMGDHSSISGETLDALEIDPSLGSYSTNPQVILAAAQAKHRQGVNQLTYSMPSVPGQRNSSASAVDAELMQRLDAIGGASHCSVGQRQQRPATRRSDWSIGTMDDDDVTFL